MEEHLGRPLKRTEQIHHKNGVRTDNRISNLQVVTKSAHLAIHRAYRDKKKKGPANYVFHKCPVCGETFARPRKSSGTKGKRSNSKNTSTTKPVKPCCSRSCAVKYRHQRNREK